MALQVLNTSPSVVGEILSDLRDVDRQGDRERFRTNIQRMSWILGYEGSKKLAAKKQRVTTPLGVAEEFQFLEQPVVATVLRAGILELVGLMQVLPKSDAAFFGAARVENGTSSPDIHLEYGGCPDLTGRDLFIADPMIATGDSLVKVHDKIREQYGEPNTITVLGIIASQAGIDRVQSGINPDHIIVGAVDPTLNEIAYIVPGLGDAGDLQFGSKQQIQSPS